MKKVSWVLIVSLLMCMAFAACGEPEKNTEDKKTNGTVSSAQSADQDQGDAQDALAASDLSFEVLGEKVSMPFSLDILLNNGYTFVDPEQEEKVKQAVDEIVPLVTLINNNEEQEAVAANPIFNVTLHCGKDTKDSLKDTYVVGFMLQSLEKKYLSVNGFGWDDNTADFMKTIKQDYEEEVGTYQNNITTGEYVVLYNYSDLYLRVYSTDGKIRILEVEQVEPDE